MDRITVSIARTTYKRLVEGAKYGESMDGIIRRLLDNSHNVTKSQQKQGGKKKSYDDMGTSSIRSGFGYD